MLSILSGERKCFTRKNDPTFIAADYAIVQRKINKNSKINQ